MRWGSEGDRTRFVRSTVREEVEVGGGGSGSDGPYCGLSQTRLMKRSGTSPNGLHSIHCVETTSLFHAMSVGERGGWDTIYIIIIVVGRYYNDDDDVVSPHNPLGVIPFIPAALSWMWR